MRSSQLWLNPFKYSHGDPQAALLWLHDPMFTNSATSCLSIPYLVTLFLILKPLRKKKQKKTKNSCLLCPNKYTGWLFMRCTVELQSYEPLGKVRCSYLWNVRNSKKLQFISTAACLKLRPFPVYCTSVTIHTILIIRLSRSVDRSVRNSGRNSGVRNSSSTVVTNSTKYTPVLTWDPKIERHIAPLSTTSSLHSSAWVMPSLTWPMNSRITDFNLTLSRIYNQTCNFQVTTSN